MNIDFYASTLVKDGFYTIIRGDQIVHEGKVGDGKCREICQSGDVIAISKTAAATIREVLFTERSFCIDHGF